MKILFLSSALILALPACSASVGDTTLRTSGSNLSATHSNFQTCRATAKPVYSRQGERISVNGANLRLRCLF